MVNGEDCRIKDYRLQTLRNTDSSNEETRKRVRMTELKDDRLVFSFPEVHPSARMTIEFQRTLRIPDDDKDQAWGHTAHHPIQ